MTQDNFDRLAKAAENDTVAYAFMSYYSKLAALAKAGHCITIWDLDKVLDGAFRFAEAADRVDKSLDKTTGEAS